MYRYSSVPHEIKVLLTDKVFWLEGVEGKREDGLCEGEPADLTASVSIPYRHDAWTQHDSQQVLTRILQSYIIHRVPGLFQIVYCIMRHYVSLLYCGSHYCVENCTEAI